MDGYMNRFRNDLKPNYNFQRKYNFQHEDNNKFK